jgi:DNA replication protein DnaC
MTARKTAPSPTLDAIEQYLRDLNRPFMLDHQRALAHQAAHQHWAHLDYRGHLVEGEARLRQDRATQRRIRLARFPVIKTLEQFRWAWPTQIHRELIQHHFTLRLLKEPSNLFYLAGVGLGKTHLAVA